MYRFVVLVWYQYEHIRMVPLSVLVNLYSPIERISSQSLMTPDLN